MGFFKRIGDSLSRSIKTALKNLLGEWLWKPIKKAITGEHAVTVQQLVQTTAATSLHEDAYGFLDRLGRMIECGALPGFLDPDLVKAIKEETDQETQEAFSTAAEDHGDENADGYHHFSDDLGDYINKQVDWKTLNAFPTMLFLDTKMGIGKTGEAFDANAEEGINLEEFAQKYLDLDFLMMINGVTHQGDGGREFVDEMGEYVNRMLHWNTLNPFPTMHFLDIKMLVGETKEASGTHEEDELSLDESAQRYIDPDLHTMINAKTHQDVGDREFLDEMGEYINRMLHWNTLNPFPTMLFLDKKMGVGETKEVSRTDEEDELTLDEFAQRYLAPDLLTMVNAKTYQVDGDDEFLDVLGDHINRNMDVGETEKASGAAVC